MKAFILAAGLLLASTSTSPPAHAAQDYDNPGLGVAPCVVLNRYEAGRHGKDDPAFNAAADIENICGRTLEVSICFLLAEAVGGSDRHCMEQLLRPWAGASVAFRDAPVRITGPEYHWRYLPVRCWGERPAAERWVSAWGRRAKRSMPVRGCWRRASSTTTPTTMPASPTLGLGVTTLIMGNCGFAIGFATSTFEGHNGGGGTPT